MFRYFLRLTTLLWIPTLAIDPSAAACVMPLFWSLSPSPSVTSTWSEQALAERLIGGQFADPGNQALGPRRDVIEESLAAKNGQPAPQPLPEIVISLTDMEARDLQVRMKRKSETVKPSHLYQWLPLNELTLIATLPRGVARVSIPHQREIDLGFHIDRIKPVIQSGFIIDYSLDEETQFYRAAHFFYKPSSEAPESIYSNLAAFYELAEAYTRRQFGDLRPSPHEYGYFAPSWENFGPVWASGFSPWHPLEGSPTVTETVIEESRRGKGPVPGINVAPAGLIYRIPVFRSSLHPDLIVRTYAAPEVTLDPHPGSESRWISYAEYKAYRARRSRRPEAILSDFQDWIVKTQRAWGFRAWTFHLGMLFNAPREWWRKIYRRRTAHEGADLAAGVNAEGQVVPAEEGFPVFAVSDGVAVHVYGDAMARSLLIRYPQITNEFGDVYHSLHTHFYPDPLWMRLAEGSSAGLSLAVKKGQYLGKIGKDPKKAPATPVHEHYSEVWIPPSIQPGDIDWDKINPNFMNIYLVDPFEGTSRFKWFARPGSHFPLEFWPALSVGAEMIPEAEILSQEKKSAFYRRLIQEMGVDFVVLPDFPPWYLPQFSMKELKWLEQGVWTFIKNSLPALGDPAWWKRVFHESPDPVEFVDPLCPMIVTLAGNFRPPWTLKPLIRRMVRAGVGGILAVSGGHPIVQWVHALPVLRWFFPDSALILRLLGEMREELPAGFRIMAVENPNKFSGAAAVARMRGQKLGLGAAGILTHPPFLKGRAQEWAALMHQEKISEKAAVLISIPLIASPDNLEFWFRLAGIPADEPAARSLLQEFEQAWAKGSDYFNDFSMAWARQLAAEAIRWPGVSGIYYMPMRRWRRLEKLPPEIRPALWPEPVSPHGASGAPADAAHRPVEPRRSVQGMGLGVSISREDDPQPMNHLRLSGERRLEPSA